MSNNAPLTCAQIAALDDGAWINEGFQAHVLKLDSVAKKAGGNFWKASLGDGPGNYTHGVTMSLFQAPRFQIGDIIRVTGKGISKKSYQNKPQVGMGKDSLLEVMPSSAKVQATVENHMAEVKGNQAQATSEALISGQQAGMAMKEALAIHTLGLTNAEVKSAVTAPGWWSEVYATASDIIRVARLLESGKLCDPVKQRDGGVQSAQRQTPPPQPKHDPEAELNEGTDAPF